MYHFGDLPVLIIMAAASGFGWETMTFEAAQGSG
jgi:hypothetical protein